MQTCGHGRATRWCSESIRVEAVKRWACTVLAVTLWLGLAVPVAAAENKPDKPIVAQLIADAGGYNGRSVTIYGLVIKVTGAGQEFLLQDVSQMPLKIMRTDGMPTSVNDQVLVEGVFFANRGDPYLKARKITYTQVLGGGGCC